MAPRRAAALVLLLVVALGGYLYWTDDERRLRRRLAELEELLQKDAPEPQIAAFGVARQVAKIFAPGFVVLAAPYEGQLSGEQELVAAVHRFRTASQTVSTHFSGVDIEIRDNATAAVGFVATVTMDFGGNRGREGYRIVSQWAEVEGEWFVTQLEVVEVLPDGPGLGLF